MNRGQSIVATLAALTLAPLAHAGSLANGNFDSNLNGWSLVDVNPAISATWVAEDRAGGAGSGAVELRNTSAGVGGVQVVLRQCINLAGISIPAPIAASAKVATEGEPGVQAWIFIEEYTAAGCAPGSQNGVSRDEQVNAGAASWQDFSGQYTPIDGSVQSVTFSLGIAKGMGAGAGGAVRFDDLLFGTPTPELTRWTIDSGGGRLTGGSYVLRGTVGQPDPGSASAGGTSLQSGFWFGESVPPGDAVFKDSFE